MPTSSKATLARGFELPNQKLLRLLQIFRRSRDGDAEDRDESESPLKPKTKSEAFKLMNELNQMMFEALESSGLDEWFAHRFCYEYEDSCNIDGDEPIFILYRDQTAYNVSRWGGENCELLPVNQIQSLLISLRLYSIDGSNSVFLGEHIEGDTTQEQRDKVVELRKVLHLDEANIELKEEGWVLLVSMW
jgi:hypothetical protein